VKLLRLLSDYRWPIYLGGLLAMPIVACGVLVWVATRPDSPRPMQGYYEAARSWDATEAVAEASRELGWSVRYELPADVPHYAGMPRPIDVHIADREGKPVSGLGGRLHVIRPADTRLNESGDLTELPQRPGSYRTLVRLDEPGAWEFRLEARHRALQFVNAARISVPSPAVPAQPPAAVLPAGGLR
jgi:nitrogen fixation protein FixH